MSERVTTAVLVPDEEELDSSLRPRSLAEFVGQERVKEQLSIALEAAKGRGEALDHVLLAGPPGLGKTSLAYIVREELGVGLRVVAGPALERKGDIAAILTTLEERDVLFVDEIHRLNRAVEEILYPALEDFRLDIVVGQGPAVWTNGTPSSSATIRARLVLPSPGGPARSTWSSASLRAEAEERLADVDPDLPPSERVRLALRAT